MTILPLAILAMLAAEPAAQPPAAQKPLADWIEALAADDAAARREAAAAIGRRGPEAKEALAALIDALGDDDANVRAEAGRALGAIGPGAQPAVPAMIAALTDREFERTDGPDGPTRVPVWIAVSKGLGNVGPSALGELIGALEHENPQVVVGACGAINVIGPEAKDAVEPLVRLVKEDTDIGRRAAMWAMMGIGPEAKAAVPTLIEALDHEDFHTQYWSCRVLRDIGPAAAPAAPKLVQLLGEGAASVRLLVLVEKERSRPPYVEADYVALTVPDRYVYGCGMDYQGYLRNAPGIFAVRGL